MPRPPVGVVVVVAACDGVALAMAGASVAGVVGLLILEVDVVSCSHDLASVPGSDCDPCWADPEDFSEVLLCRSWI